MGFNPKARDQVKALLRKAVGPSKFKVGIQFSYNSGWRKRSKFRMKGARVGAGMLNRNPLRDVAKCKAFIQAQVLSCFWSVWQTASHSHITMRPPPQNLERTLRWLPPSITSFLGLTAVQPSRES